MVVVNVQIGGGLPTDSASTQLRHHHVVVLVRRQAVMGLHARPEMGASMLGSPCPSCCLALGCPLRVRKPTLSLLFIANRARDGAWVAFIEAGWTLVGRSVVLIGQRRVGELARIAVPTGTLVPISDGATTVEGVHRFDNPTNPTTFSLRNGMTTIPTDVHVAVLGDMLSRERR